MEPIPLYDATAPITCTVAVAEIPARIEQIERLKAVAGPLERTEHGIVLHFPANPEVEADVRQFALDEKRCCQFWGFAVENVADGLTLRWDGPPDSRALLDQLVAYFEGEEPLEAILDLL